MTAYVPTDTVTESKQRTMIAAKKKERNRKITGFEIINPGPLRRC